MSNKLTTLLEQKKALDVELKKLGACTETADGAHWWVYVPEGSWRDTDFPAYDRCKYCREEREPVKGTPSVDGGGGWYA